MRCRAVSACAHALLNTSLEISLSTTDAHTHNSIGAQDRAQLEHLRGALQRVRQAGQLRGGGAGRRQGRRARPRQRQGVPAQRVRSDVLDRAACGDDDGGGGGDDACARASWRTQDGAFLRARNSAARAAAAGAVNTHPRSNPFKKQCRLLPPPQLYSKQRRRVPP